MTLFTNEQLALINPNKIPRHVAIIGDGNRRWAKKHALTTPKGHQKGADALLDIVQAAKELQIKAVTFFAFSTENWTRPKDEIDALMFLLATYLTEQLPAMLKNGIRFHTIGNLNRFPPNIIEIVEKTKRETLHCGNIDLILALNYGGRDEITRAMHKLIDDFTSQKIKREEIGEAILSRYLDTFAWPDPDLLIRTSGEQRISNFLLWQISYTELYMTDLYWPDFKPIHLLDAVIEFQKRERRLGGA
jgi:undecaprenyl diphosphate synthase